LVAILAAFLVVATACGGSTTPGTSKGTLTVGGFNFPESSILANIYGQALAHDGYTINYKLLLGHRGGHQGRLDRHVPRLCGQRARVLQQQRGRGYQ
jgi:osmoprotectant transport system substrate-binding protein